MKAYQYTFASIQLKHIFWSSSSKPLIISFRKSLVCSWIFCRERQERTYLSRLGWWGGGRRTGAFLQFEFFSSKKMIVNPLLMSIRYPQLLPSPHISVCPSVCLKFKCLHFHSQLIFYQKKFIDEILLGKNSFQLQFTSMKIYPPNQFCMRFRNEMKWNLVIEILWIK